MTLRQVASFLQVSPMTVYRLVDRRAIAVHRVARRLRFARRDVVRFLECRKQYVREAV